MARPELLDENQINSELKSITNWDREGKLIVREFAGANFPAVIGMVNAIAVVAEKENHHPDMQIYGWNKLRVSLSTHDKGGLTELDFKMAKNIEGLKLD